jgi:hypothetical protein
MADVMSYVMDVMQTNLAGVRRDLIWENDNLAAAQKALADAQTRISELKANEAELVSHLKANGWAETPAS